jgi:hypothetical protein
MQPKPGTNVFYHGTSIEAALSIQETGFLVSKSGSYKGAMLGPGLYVTTTLEKAINYATGKKRPDGGAVFVLHVDLGNCYTVRHNDPYIRKWQEEGYDSAWSGEGVNGQREEHCIKDPRPPRVQIVDVIFGNTRKATAAGFSVENGRICKAGEAPHLANSMGGSGVVEQWVQPYPKITAEQLEGCYICMCFPLALLYVAPGRNSSTSAPRTVPLYMYHDTYHANV